MLDWWKAYRAIDTHPVWKLPGTHFKVWFAILNKANYTDKEWFNGTERVTIPAGTFITSQDNLAEYAGVTRRVVQKAIHNLIALDSIRFKTRFKRYSEITVVNWHTYQYMNGGEVQEEVQERFKSGSSQVHNLRRKESKKERIELSNAPLDAAPTGFASWPPEWKPIQDRIHTIPILTTYKHWLDDLDWWRTLDELFSSCPKNLDGLLLEAAAYIKTEGYRPRSARALRMKLRNCMEFSARRAERERQSRTA